MLVKVLMCPCYREYRELDDSIKFFGKRIQFHCDCSDDN